MEKNLLEPTPLPPSVRADRVAIGSPVYNEILEFLIDEAEMLDQLRLNEWRETLDKGKRSMNPILPGLVTLWSIAQL